MIRRLVVFVAVMSSACPQPIADRCGDGLPPCSAGLVCVAGLCARTDADGGLATDAGTRPDAGASDAGSSDAGSSDAGVVVGCDGGCAPWAVCIGSNVAASCVNGRLEVSEPVDATSLRAGQAVSLAASFVLVDGGAWPNTLAIPVQASWGPQTMLLSGIAGSVPGLSDAGLGSVVFGWDGGPIEPRAVSFTACAAEVVASCDTFLECAPSVSGGGCVSRGYVVEWVSPDAGSATNQASVAAEIRVSKPDGGVVTLTSIPVTGATAFTGAAGRYTGVLPIAAPDGVKTFTAGWPSDGASSTLTIERDTIAPSVTVIVEPRNGPDPDPVDTSAWKLDQKVLVRVRVDGGGIAGLSSVVVPDGGRLSLESACQDCAPTDCRCFGLDMSRSEIAGIRDTRWIQVVQVSDKAGNVSAAVDAGVHLTRVLWQRDISLLDAGVRLRPVAVSQEGEVVAAVEDRPGSLSRVSVFSQRGAAVPVPAVTGSVSSGPVVAGTTIWVGQYVGGVRSLAPSVLQGPPATSLCSATAARLRDDMAVMSVGGVEMPLAVGDEGLLLGSGGCASYPVSSAPNSRVPVVSSNSPPSAFLLSGTLHKVGLDGGGWLSEGSISAGVLSVGSNAKSLFFDGQGQVGGSSEQGPLGEGLFSTSALAALNDAVVVRRVVAGVGGVTVAQTNLTGVSNANMLSVHGFAGSTSSLGAGSLFPSPVLSSSAPILGASSWLYLVGVRTVGGSLAFSLAVARRPVSGFSWVGELSFPSSTGSPRVAEPALDVYRTDAGVKDCGSALGVLYLLTSSGPTATLHAILVDSNGLDPTAPWPKFQRDNANRGNISMPITPWICP